MFSLRWSLIQSIEYLSFFKGCTDHSFSLVWHFAASLEQACFEHPKEEGEEVFSVQTPIGKSDTDTGWSEKK